MVRVQSPGEAVLSGPARETGAAGAEQAPDGEAATGPRPLLLLFADTGGGHRASASAVRAAVATRHGGRYRGVLVRPFEELSPRFVGRAVHLYAPVVRRAPWAWGLAWHLTDSRPAVRMLRGGFLRLAEPGLTAEVARLRPAAVVSFHPLLNDAAVRAVRALPGGAVPVVTVVTDLVDLHASWMCAEVAAVVAATPGAYDRCLRAGVPVDRCHELGLAVDAAFSSAPDGAAERGRARAALGLDPGRFTVLVLGGGEGSGGIEQRVRALTRAGLDISVVAICGRNAALAERLGRLDPHPPAGLRVLGFVDNMAEWLRAADVAVSKAGPAAIAEAAATRTPLVLTSYVPGQEPGNVGLVERAGTGRWMPGIGGLVDTIRDLAAPGSADLARMRAALGRGSAADLPRAADRIADLVCTLADGAAGAWTAAPAARGPSRAP
ncbi:MAG TPA: glycosyltransferase [Candidatus Dormibacteraeota bacterium]|nr:glycosyltransferase [Candidatus Dormibacteraeota bacterium]